MELKECVDCGDEIPVKRVKALPHVETCVGCQEEREAKGRFVKHKINTKIRYATGGEIESMDSEIVRG